MMQEQAIADLKKAKELLELEIITQEDFDKIKAELLPSLRMGFDCPRPKTDTQHIQDSTLTSDITKTSSIIDLEAEAMAAGEVEEQETPKNSDGVSTSDNAFAAFLAVVVSIMIGAIATFIVTNNSKKGTAVQSKSTAVITTKKTASLPPATEAEITEAWSQWLKLYDELEQFKKKTDFHNYGLSLASPYRNWAKRVEDLGQTNGGKQLLNRYEVSSGDLTQLAWQYIRSKGKDNDYTKYIAKIVKKKKQKVVVEQEPAIEDVSNTKSSSQEVIIGQWKVTNRYVEDLVFDVIIKKEGTKYYAYKAGNKKEVRKKGNKYYEVGNEWGEYYYITSDGNMKFGDEDGLVAPEVGYVIDKK